MDSLLDCGVCLQRHDEDKRRPLVIPCGHTLCTTCIDKSLMGADEKLVCPFCRKSFDLKNNKESCFPDNYTILQILTLKENVEASGSCIKESSKEHGQKEDINILKQNDSQSITDNISAIRKYLDNIEEYKIQLGTQKASQKEVLLRFEEEFKSHIEKLEQLGELISKVILSIDDSLGEGEDFIQGLEATKVRLEAAVSTRGAKAAAKDAKRSFTDYQEWMVSIAENSKIVEESKEIIGKTSQCLNVLCKSLNLEKDNSRIYKRCISSSITIESLRTMVIKTSVGVWTSLKKGNKDYVAQITLTEGCLLLRSLSKRIPPLNAVIIPYQKCKNLVDRSKIITFLEINAQPSLGKQLIHIQLAGNEGRTQQFELMCTGEVDGISYANTTFSGSEGSPLGVWGGIRNDDHDSALPGFVSGSKIMEDIVPGLVAGYYYKDPNRKPTHFKIYTAETSNSFENCPIGKVVYGLDHIKTIIGSINIIDCGIILSEKL